MKKMPDWNLAARRMLRIELARKDISYKQLSSLLEKIGVDETTSAIRNKLARGTFSLAFFLQCMWVLDRKTVSFDLNELDLE